MKKHIVCFGDSNTHGYCAVKEDCEDGTNRFNENERWTCLLQKKLGEDYLVIEEGLSGRTTVFNDPLHESMSGLDAINIALMSHEPVDLLIIMLGTNDTKDRLGANASCIAIGMERLITKAKNTMCWKDKPNILVIAPPHIKSGLYLVPEGEAMGLSCVEKSEQLASKYEIVAKNTNCAFLDAEGVAEFNNYDCMHLTKKGHQQLCEAIGDLIPSLLKS